MKNESEKIKKKYKNNYLSKVILRLDFNRIDLDSVEDIYSEKFKKRFPSFSEKKDIFVSLEGGVASEEVRHSRNESKVFLFEDENKNKRLRLGSEYAFIEYDKYESFDELENDISSAISTIILSLKIKTINRLGLRYINEIKIKDRDPLNWNDYISKNLLSALNFYKLKKEKISRSMGQVVLKKDKADLSFGYGIFNKEFPSEINIKEFVLDIDCYSPLPFEVLEENIEERICLYHSYIKEIFEDSITQKFRDFLNK